MSRAKSHLPEGIRTVTPTLVFKSTREAIDWYQKAFSAQVVSVAPGPAPGSIVHAHIRIGDSAIYMADVMPGSPVQPPSAAGNASASITLFVPDADALYDQALKAGAEVLMPIADMFWGDRYATLKDPFGCVWAIATHKEDLSAQELDQRTRDFFASAAAGANRSRPSA